MVLFESIPESEGKIDITGNYGVGPQTIYHSKQLLKEKYYIIFLNHKIIKIY